MGLEDWFSSLLSSKAALLDMTYGELASIPAVLLSAAVLAEMLLPLSQYISLSRTVPALRALAVKLNFLHLSLAQQRLAGILYEALITIALLMLFLFTAGASGYPRAAAFLLLFLLLKSQTVTLKLKKALSSNDLQSAKILLKKQVLRDTSKLSAMGLAKACSESTILRLFASWFAIIVWTLLLGPEGAILMASAVIFTEAFSMKDHQYSSLGLFAAHYEQAMLIIPACVLTLLTFALTRHPLLAIKEGLRAAERFPSKVSGYVLGLVGYSLDISLGGPRYYKESLLRYEKVGSPNKTNPDAQSMVKVLRRMRLYGFLLLAAAVILSILSIKNPLQFEQPEDNPVIEQLLPHEAPNLPEFKFERETEPKRELQRQPDSLNPEGGILI